jgi:hypothetical protein
MTIAPGFAPEGSPMVRLEPVSDVILKTLPQSEEEWDKSTVAASEKGSASIHKENESKKSRKGWKKALCL